MNNKERKKNKGGFKMRKYTINQEIFPKTWEEFQQLEIDYNLEDCGMSGLYYGYHWFQDDQAGVAVYVK